jgi:hypothetical protein
VRDGTLVSSDNSPGAPSDKAQWASTADQVLRKPANAITMDDAKNMTSKEVWLSWMTRGLLTTPDTRL